MAPPSLTSNPSKTAKDVPQEEEENDYMTMVIAEPSVPVKETSIQRRARKQREAEIKARVKSKEERAADEAAAREAALNTSSIDESNKGFKMMAKLGFKPGSALGKTGDARTEPIRLAMKEDRGGVGLDSEKKRKVREEAERELKKVKVDEEGYRARMRRETEERRLTKQILSAQKVAQTLDEDAEVEKAQEEGKEKPQEEGNKKPQEADRKPLKSVNVLWRGLLKQRIEEERERRMRYDLQQSLSRLPTYDDPTEDEDDKRAIGKVASWKVLEEEIEEEDSELDEFNALELGERLQKLVLYMRDTYHYCYWCKYRYPDATMEECPGITEEDHD